MRTTRNFLMGCGIGAISMYMFDPRYGRRRRAILRDKMVHTACATRRGLSTSARDLGHRIKGTICEARGLLSRGSVTDEVLEARIRSAIGRVVSHPHAIHVTCDSGCCMLSGPVLRSEVDNLISCVQSIRGVTECIDELEIHDFARRTPSLQGGVRRNGARFELLQDNWAPATRLIMGTMGSAMSIYGGSRRGVMGTLMAGAGLGIVARSLTNMDFSSMVGVGDGEHGIEVRKSIEINAPVEQVYGFWTRFENFPSFMSHLREVRELGRGRSRWTAFGPAGIPIQWDAMITRDEPNELLCWKSEEGSVVENSGRIRFERCGDHCTRLHIQMSYLPPAGALGHVIARMFAVDPKTSMDDDLIRLKSLFEEGKTHSDGQLITAGRLALRQSQAIRAR